MNMCVTLLYNIIAYKPWYDLVVGLVMVSTLNLFKMLMVNLIALFIGRLLIKSS